ncbi:MAG: hypothetical protein KY476_22325 [Planctomycetes bacterium]|nr:hypothetical protein [Planctomycetota bacterium]
MKQRVKVTMVGGKNVGKTCFLHGMYYVMRRGVNNFFLHAHDADSDNRLMRGWSALNRRGEDRRWPVPTHEDITRYDFSFKIGMHRTLMDFEWVDYRGGALEEDTASSQELIDHLNESDCLFFCLDGSELRTPVAERLYDVDSRLCISRAKVLLDGMSRRVPVAVLITKHDCCRHRAKDELMADIRLLFDAWLVPGEGWDVLICPVTLGRQLAEDINGGQIDPKNLHVPLVYSTFSLVVEGLVDHETKARMAAENQEVAERRIQESRGGFLTNLLKKSDIEAAQLEAEQWQRQRAAEERAANRLRQDVAALGRELTNAVMYCDGRRVQIRPQHAATA